MLRLNSCVCACAGIALMIGAMAPSPAEGQPPIHYALDFDGVDDYAEVSDPVSLTGPFTIEAWVFYRGGSGRICANSMGITGYDFDIANSRLRFAISNQNQISTDFGAYVGQWTHVAVRGIGEIGADVSLFINGELAATATIDDTLVASTTNLHIGCLTIGMYFLDGALDELRVWNAELDESTIQAYMHATVDAGHPRYASLQGYWCFDEAGGQVATCQVGGGMRDARLGADPAEDDADPVWVASGVLPIETVRFGDVKAEYLGK